MKLLEKLKNTFFEEEYIEVEEEEKPKAVAKKVEIKEIKREPLKREVKEIKKDIEEEIEEIEEIEEKPVINYNDGELARKDSKLPYFEDEDFMDVGEPVAPVEKKEESRKLYGGFATDLYSSIRYNEEPTNKPYNAPLKEAFKPTPIISPIYGILDKNYTKEEVVDKKPTSSYVSRKNVDLDSIRKKAYGGLDPLDELSSSYNDDPEEEVKEDDLLYDMTEDNTMPAVDKVTIADAEEYFEDLGLEYNIDYKDVRYEKATGRRTSTKPNKKEEEVVEEEANLEDNLFDLIDSMYEEGEE